MRAFARAVYGKKVTQVKAFIHKYRAQMRGIPRKRAR